VGAVEEFCGDILGLGEKSLESSSQKRRRAIGILLAASMGVSHVHTFRVEA
jgi:hypothetical protein